MNETPDNIEQSPQHSALESLLDAASDMARDMLGCPRVGFTIVDVRDVAEAHVRALTASEAAGRRLICTGEFQWLTDLARVLDDHLADRGYQVPTRGLPNWLVHLAALFDPTVRLVTGQLGRRAELDTSQIRSTLDWSPRPVAETIRDTADSLIAHNIV